MQLLDHCTQLQYDILDSTLNEAQRRITAGSAVHGDVIITRLQLAGYGSRQRHWISTENDLTFTIILQCAANDDTKSIAQISYVAGIAIADAMLSMSFGITKENLKLKWVNDILVDDGKIAGILLQKIKFFVLIGIGINFVPQNIKDRKISYIKLYSESMTREALLGSILQQFAAHYNHWVKFGFKPIQNRWLSYSYCVGSEITITYKGQKTSGSFLGITEDGALLFRKAHVQTHTAQEVQDTCSTIEKIYANDIGG